VGAPTEAELKSRKEALDDAIAATRAAIAEGIVPGGGLAFLRAIEPVAREAERATGDERTGLLILAQALEVPTRTIAENSAADGGVVVGDLKRGTGAHGFDAARGTYCDLLAAGIVDPTKVLRVAVENAVSVAGTLLLTEATLTEVEDEKPEAAALAAEP
jgi:chaperonin GroEL